MMLHSRLKRVARKIPTEPLGVLTCHLTVYLTFTLSTLSFMPYRLQSVYKLALEGETQRFPGSLRKRHTVGYLLPLFLTDKFNMAYASIFSSV